MNRLIHLTLFLLALAAGSQTFAAVPMLLNYQGNVVDGTGMAVDGTGYFKFAIVNQAGDNAYWVNNGAAMDGSEPPNGIAIPVSNGAFAVKLGDTNLTNMAAITQSIFDNPAIYLRVWFSTDNINFEQFASDIQILSAGFAFKAAVADTVLESTVTSETIQDNSITNADINDSAAISASKIDTLGLDADTLDGLNSTDFASATHNHDSSYAPLLHNHDARYSLLDHNHDSSYAPIVHTHNYAGSTSPGGAANDLSCTSCVSGSEITDSTITNADISASAAISALKLSNGAGGDYVAGPGSTSLTTTDAIITSVTLVAPSSGLALLNASGYFLYSGGPGTGRCSITTTSNLDTNGSYVVASGDSSIGITYNPFGSTAGFTVSAAGTVTYNLVCNVISGTINIIWPKMTAIFVPIRY